MDLLWPGFLLLLGLIPLLIGVYIWILRRRRRFARALSPASRWCARRCLATHGCARHLPFALFLLRSAQPDRRPGTPGVDCDRADRPDDDHPHHRRIAEHALSPIFSLTAWQRQRTQRYRSFKTRNPTRRSAWSPSPGLRELVNPPTTDQEALQSAVESLTMGRSTAIGSGILKAIDAIAEIDQNVAPSMRDGSSGAEPTPVPKGAYAPDIIVLLTDGVSNAGPCRWMPRSRRRTAGSGCTRLALARQRVRTGTVRRSVWRRRKRSLWRWSAAGRFRRGIDEATLKKSRR